MITRGREWAARLLLVAASFAVAAGASLFVLETWLRTQDLPRDAGTMLRPHPSSPRLIRLEPNADAQFTGVPVRANRYGYRGGDWSLEKPPGVFRIAILGDSQTFGYGVRLEDTYPARLETLLRERHPDRVWEVMNFGMIGYNTSQQAEACSLDGSGFDCDLIILGFFMNDVDPPIRPVDVAPISDEEVAARRRRAGLAYRVRSLRSYTFLRTRVAALARRVGVTEGASTTRYRDLFLSRGTEWRACETGLRALRDAARARDARFGVVILPFIVSLDASYPMTPVHQQIADLCEAEGIRCEDLLPAFLGHDEMRLCVTPMNNHMNAEGNRIAAEAIASWVERLLEDEPPQ